ncbi:Gamma-aminobutyric acid (GABA) B receptor [Seminavis robusta]|uniref:Gamma-aminobutyric acid (GABA) B receptor n=1 Tax=Seminavis robusta TaxID=568900 RepID=A0A9N8HSB9_9STRA|nr:Gamma-aminobutyric acid (GABA) B receptor [Seminavis robusta]|eukprot:Sro1152_g246820.1 Gamma-aminobutyric acid (GABA) B receptor (1125) ;mRNA; r:704-4078
MSSSATINLIGCAAPLLSARTLSDCQSAEDPTCEGGVAAVAALARHHASTDNGDQSTLIIPRLDRQHEFVQSHPQGWNVNTLVLHQHFGWNVVTSHPSLVEENQQQQELTLDDSIQEQSPPMDLSGLQTPDMPIVMTNVALPPSNSWHPYVQSVHFDTQTRIAIIALEEELPSDTDDGNSISWSQVESAWSSLDFIAAENKRQNCGDSIPTTTTTTSLPTATATPPTATVTTNIIRTNTTNDTPSIEQDADIIVSQRSASNNNCWIPIILVYKNRSSQGFDRLVSTVSKHKHPPALIVDWEGTQKAYNTPKVTEEDVWIVSQPMTSDSYIQFQMTINDDTRRIDDLTILSEDLMEPLPAEFKDSQYASDIDFLRNLADEAIAHDPILGNSNAMPRADTGQCRHQECEIGNLFADSLQWWQQQQQRNNDVDSSPAQQVAFLRGDSITGPGWSFGQIHISDIWKTLPYPVTVCTGKVSGLSLLRVLDHAVRHSGRESPRGGNNATTTAAGDLSPFLQVSGLQVVYFGSSSSSQGSSTRLISVKVWDQNERAYVPLNPLRLYRFTTESSMCDETESSFASLLGGDDNDSATRMESKLLQNIVGEYLQQLDATYVPHVEDRLMESTDESAKPLNFASTAGACPEGTYWEGNDNLCQSCPNTRDHVTISDSSAEFTFQHGDTLEPQTGRVVIVNRDLHNYLVTSRDLPRWFKFTGVDSLSSSRQSLEAWPELPVRLASGEEIAFDYAINASKVGVGNTYHTIFFNISAYQPISTCGTEPYTLPLGTLVQVNPPPASVGLGYHSSAGFTLLGLILMGCLALASWVFLKRERWGYGTLEAGKLDHKFSPMPFQPIFLVAICFGVMTMAFTLLALSIEEAWQCLAAPWLLSFGLTIVFSALISNLSAAKKMILEPPNEHVIQMSARYLLKAFAALFIVNFGILCFMLLDPPTWGQKAVDDEDWKSYGFCDYSDPNASLLIASGVTHFLTLCYAVYQAYHVSNMSEEFQELKTIMVALCVWFQVTVIAIPTWFTIDKGSMIGQYYFKVVTISTLCVSMLLCIFLPVITKKFVPPVKTIEEKDEDYQSLFGGFMGFNHFAGSAVSNRDIHGAPDEEVPQEEQNRCLTDKVCYYQ